MKLKKVWTKSEIDALAEQAHDFLAKLSAPGMGFCLIVASEEKQPYFNFTTTIPPQITTDLLHFVLRRAEGDGAKNWKPVGVEEMQAGAGKTAKATAKPEPEDQTRFIRKPDDEDYEPPGPLQEFTVVYFGRKEPIRFQEARFQAFKHPDPNIGILPSIFLPGKEVVILDPRAMVFNETRHTLDYSPRIADYIEHLPPEMREEMDEYPNWGVVGCEQDWDKARRRREEA